MGEIKRIPRTIRLLGHTIRVRQVDQRTLQECLRDTESKYEGAWDHTAMTIFVHKALSLRRKRDVLFHELGHAIIDLKDADAKT